MTLLKTIVTKLYSYKIVTRLVNYGYLSLEFNIVSSKKEQGKETPSPGERLCSDAATRQRIFCTHIFFGSDRQCNYKSMLYLYLLFDMFTDHVGPTSRDE